MKEFKSLKIVDKFKNIYKKFGVDYDTMRLILKVKLTMDQRRTPTVLNNKKNENSDKKSNNMRGALFLYGVSGLFIGMFVILKFNIMLQMSLVFGMLMFMIGMIFMSDFSYVLLDVRDENIISTKGISSRTINAAKLTHILIYIFTISIALGGFTVLASLRYGILFAIIVFIEIILIDLLMVIVSAFLYYIILKFFNGEKLKDIINIVQIFLTIAMMVMYQFIGHVFDFIESSGGVNVNKLWAYFMPSFWFAAPLEMLENRYFNITLIILSLLAVAVPIIAICIYFKMSKSFEKYIQKLSNNTYKAKDKTPLLFKFSKIVCRKPMERVFFNFVNDVIRSERKFKLKTYPTVVFAVILPFIVIINTTKHIESFEAWRISMSNSKYYFTLYFTIGMLGSIISMIKYSDQYKGAWVYNLVSNKDLPLIYKGMFKAVFYRINLPLFILVSIILVLICTTKIIPNLIVLFLTMLIISLLASKYMCKRLPFSKAFSVTNNGEDTLAVFAVLFATGILAFIHFLTTLIWWGGYAYILGLLLIIIELWYTAFNVKPHELKKIKLRE